MDKINWYTKEPAEIFSLLNTSSQGLSEIEAQKRLKIYGLNEFELFKKPNILFRFLSQFNNILIYILLISAVITFFLQHIVDCSVILGVVVLNAIFGFIQEGKAEKAIAAIKEILTPVANVVRDGKYVAIPAKFLVPGDIVIIKTGDKIPADVRLIETKNFQVQEAVLTGESNAIEKNTLAVAKNASLGERRGLAYAGTIVVTGKGTGIVVNTGTNTEVGKIGVLLKKVKPLSTPLLTQMNVFGRWLTLIIIIIALVTFLIGVFIWHLESEQMFMAAVSLAVAAIPEGLPPILTIILAIGVSRMAKHNAIVRQLPFVETMGAVTVICTDKTGTLTRNEQTIKNIITPRYNYFVEENGEAVFSMNGSLILLDNFPDLKDAIISIALCNDAKFTKIEGNKWHFHGDPIDKALLEIGAKSHIDLYDLQQNFPRTDLIPYETEHKFMATLHHDHIKQGYIFVKGAPEYILDRCIKDENYFYWVGHIEKLTSQGYRVIAVAKKNVSLDKRMLLFEDINFLNLQAVIALIDAPRQEAISAVMECQAAGIKVKMITGDHAATALTIAKQVGIDTQAGVLLGKEIDNMEDEILATKVKEINVFARTSPQHKLRIVKALQSQNEIVAMTGDGVNDAPALRKADIGIAMGYKGSEVAKEASVMVLADNNFASIVRAVKEGRAVFDNLKKVTLFILPTNFAEAFVIVIAILFGLVLPITPVQILWINMITAVTLAIALGFEPSEGNVMNFPPRKPKMPILSKFLVWRIIFVTFLIVSGVFVLFNILRHNGFDILALRTMAVNLIVISEVVYLINSRKLYESSFNLRTIFGSKYCLIAIGSVIFFQLLFTYLPLMQHFFGTENLSLFHWFWISFVSFVIFLLVELEKIIMRKFNFSVR